MFLTGEEFFVKLLESNFDSNLCPPVINPYSCKITALYD